MRASPANTTDSRVWLAVGALTVLYTYAFIDRTIIALLVDPIKADFGLTDVEMSLLLGLAFVIFYSLLNLPAGYLVDRYGARRILGVSALLWSLMTLACGLTQNYWQLFAGRAGVGLAEATLGPAAFAIIRGQVAVEQRGRAFSVYSAGPFLGGSLALILGAAILGAAESGSLAKVPWVGALTPWKAVLVLVGAGGVPLSLLARTLPLRERSAESLQGAVSSRAAVAHLWSNRGAFGLLILYVSLCAMMAFGRSAWTPAMMARQFALPTAHIGYVLAFSI